MFSQDGKRKQRVKFSEEDNSTVFAKFGMIITGTCTISEKIIRKKIDGDDRLKEIECKFGIRTLTEKVRTLRKKYMKDKC